MCLRIKNWKKFQHFKDRCPPWIKMYRDILDDPDWHALDGGSAKVLIGLWLIASEDETHSGKLPELRKLAFRLRIQESELEQHLANLGHWIDSDIDSGGYQCDISVISERYHLDAPETETETETERDLCAPSSQKSGKRFVRPTVEEISVYCRERGNDVDPQQFFDHYEANGWMRGKTKLKDWQAAVRTWERNTKPGKSKQNIFMGAI
jgi:hypothetical protein